MVQDPLEHTAPPPPPSALSRRVRCHSPASSRAATCRPRRGFTGLGTRCFLSSSPEAADDANNNHRRRRRGRRSRNSNFRTTLPVTRQRVRTVELPGDSHRHHHRALRIMDTGSSRSSQVHIHYPSLSSQFAVLLLLRPSSLHDGDDHHHHHHNHHH